MSRSTAADLGCGVSALVPNFDFDRNSNFGPRANFDGPRVVVCPGSTGSRRIAADAYRHRDGERRLTGVFGLDLLTVKVSLILIAYHEEHCNLQILGMVTRR